MDLYCGKEYGPDNNNNKNKLSSQPGAVHKWPHFYKQQRFCLYIYDVTTHAKCTTGGSSHIKRNSHLPFLEASFPPYFSFLCGLHEVYSHIMASPDLFIYLFVYESRASVTWCSVVVLVVSLGSSNFFQVIVWRVSSPYTSQQIQTQLVL